MVNCNIKLKFSIIVPLYNKGDYIIRAVESILNQTYKNFEIIIVDDGSKDDGVIKVENLDNHLIKIIKQENQGVSRARNVGVINSKYDYVVFLDADDSWESIFLEELKNLINNFPFSGIYGINNCFHYANGKSFFKKFNWLFRGEKEGIILDYFDLFSKLGMSPFSNSSTCIPKKVFNEIGGYMVGIKTTEDSDLWCRIAIKHKVAFNIKPLVNYYLEVPNNTRSIVEYNDFQVSRTLQELLIKDKVPEKFINSVKRLIAFQQISLVKRAILTGNKKFAIKKLFDSRIFYKYPFKQFFLFLVVLIPLNIFVFLRLIYNKLFK